MHDLPWFVEMDDDYELKRGGTSYILRFNPEIILERIRKATQTSLFSILKMEARNSSETLVATYQTT
jgi:hypothetical protein